MEQTAIPQQESTKPDLATTLKIKVLPIHVFRASLFMAESDILYYLNGIHFCKAERGGVYVVATDGHRIGISYDATGIIEGAPDDEGVTLTISKQMISACKPTKSLGITMSFIAEGKRLSIAPDFNMQQSSMEQFVQAGDPIIHGRFPDWRRILPNFNKLKRGALEHDGININYLAKLTRLHSDRFSGINVWQESHGQPVIIQHNRIPEFISIIMPMRTDDYEPNHKKFFDQFPQKPAPSESDAAGTMSGAAKPA